MSTTFPELVRTLKQFNQEHLLTNWDRFPSDVQRAVLDLFAEIDLEELRQLYSRRDVPRAIPIRERLAPIPVEPQGSDSQDDRCRGEESLARGEVAVLLMAGGQGSRLGFEQPKGLYPIGPISGKTLFEIHADKLFAIGRRYGRLPPLLVITSPATHAATERHFAAHEYFGLPAESVHLLQQSTMPVLDLATARILLDASGNPITSPNGHGGALAVLAKSGILDELGHTGIRHLFYLQVDNPLVRIADPVFLGRHLAARSEVSSKVIFKELPEERVGVFVLNDGKCSIIEYCDMPASMTSERGADGELVFRAGNPAIHFFDIDFVRRVIQHGTHLPYHGVQKKVPYFDCEGHQVTPDIVNALKFESFIFDSFPLAERWLVMATNRHEEFAPLKNANGDGSPAAVRQALVNLAAHWLAQTGVELPRDAAGNLVFPVEVSARFALDAAEFTSRISPLYRVQGPTYWA